MFKIKNTGCLLYRLQKKQNSCFDGTSYTENMEDIFQDLYQLPGLVKRFDASSGNLSHFTSQPYDELFIWSLLLYAGKENDLKLAKHFWYKSKYPIACCLLAISVLKYFLGENFIPEDLKEKLNALIK